MRTKILFYIFLVSSFLNTVTAQKYITTTGRCEIYSETVLSSINGINKKVASILNTANGEIIASTLIRSFRFEDAYVEEHFNKGYLEPDKYPSAVFKGKIENFSRVDLNNNGIYNIIITGKFTIHGQTRNITEAGKLIIKDGNISAVTEFKISLKDYKIQVERAYINAIKDEISLRVSFDYKPFK